ncbi:hypothetical protein [Mucilaginibacter panaciglaebae]|uniref:Uncharacterized protein n=1 Tax=Mucilaginibacter panaciglaebae TaxID=502331 RepID=A0ABP7W893_9SPHI
MKKLIAVLTLVSFVSLTTLAQTAEKVKVKHTSTIGQKVHNTFSKHKHYSGYKVKKKVEKPATVVKP